MSCCVIFSLIQTIITESQLINYLMERQQKGMKLQAIRAINKDERISTHSKDTHMSRFRISHVSERYQRTEPSVDNIRDQMPKKHSKNKTEFSEQYMSLVNKLRINLNKNIDKPHQIQVVQERQYLFNGEDKNLPFVAGKQAQKKKYPYFPKEQSKIKKRSMTAFHKQSEPQVKTYRKRDSHPNDLSFFKNSIVDMKKQSYLPSMNRLQKGRHQHNDIINEVTQHNSPEKTKKMTKKKAKTVKKVTQQKAIMVRSGNKPHQHQHEPTNQQSLKQLNENYPKIDQLCFHIEILINMLQKMNAKDNSQESPQKIIRILKDYILGNKKYVDSQSRIIVDDISHLDRIYKQPNNQKYLRTMIFYERTLIIYCIDLAANHTIQKHQNEINHIFNSLLGIYLYFIYILKQSASLSQYSQTSLETFQEKVAIHNFHIKRQIQTAVFFISKKLFSILKSNLVLFKQIKVLVVEFQNRSVTINRAFYQLLRLYAIYLNNNEHLIEKYYNTVKTFATCPSPYLTKPSQKKYTLVLDLDQTLIHSHRQRQKLEIFMRPFLKEFLQVMSNSYEIVIFTSSMPEYSQEIIVQLPFISHKLYRYHTTRLKHRHIKDLSRLGRPLETVVMIDNEQQNFILQKANGIKIPQWIGDNPQDRELNILGIFLNKLAQNNTQDVREYLCNYKIFRRQNS